MDFNKIEQKILEFWKEKKIFEKSVERRKGQSYFSFYDGPPFATGLPHYGHILSSVSKDVVPRYKTMRGFLVERRWGWDCHGLPIENIVEEQLGIKSKIEIEKDIEGFNNACRDTVLRYAEEWKKMVEKIGRFVDFDSSYKTMDNDYMESVWWGFKELWKKGAVYEGYRTSLYCPRCVTPLSNFEIAMDNSYKEETEDSIYVLFKIKNVENEYFIAWTTTPWTLLANVALAIGPKINYIKAKINNKIFVLAESRKEILPVDYEIIEKIKGRELEGLKYEPIFLAEEIQKKGYKVVLADFVEEEGGSGIVHIAPAFGVDDHELAREEDLPMFLNIDEEGRFIDGKWVGEKVWIANKKIIDYLEENNYLLKREKFTHSYPFCWRCDTKLLYKAQKDWFIKISAIKEKMIEENEKINWHPAHLKKGRFGKGLEAAPDWNVSRSRYWGNPIPIWRCDKCDNIKVVGSFAELKELSGKILKDYHRPFIDEVKFKCDECEGKMTRIVDVFDCWVESGSMPFAELHYPFENEKKFEQRFPADFISEYIAQTRGWFYTLHVLATGIFSKPSFLNAVTTGTVLNEKGEKLSKSRKNFPDPWELIKKYPVDALRLYLMSSPLMLAENLNFSEKGVEEIYRRDIATLGNSLSFFKIYAAKDFILSSAPKIQDALDKWILSRINSFNDEMISFMDSYEITRAARLITAFIDDLSNWFIRRSRRRFQKPKSKEEYDNAVKMLGYILMECAKIIAPFAPFIAEYIYGELNNYCLSDTLVSGESKDNIKDPSINSGNINGGFSTSSGNKIPESVHLCDYPEPNEKLIDKKLEKQMKQAREIVAKGLALRMEKKIKIRQPLTKLKIKDEKSKIDDQLIDLIKDELNVKSVVFDKNIENEIELDTEITAELKEEGLARELVRQIQQMRKEAGFVPKDVIDIRFKILDIRFKKIMGKWAEFIMKETKASTFEEYKDREKFDLEKEINLNGEEIKIGIVKV